MKTISVLLASAFLLSSCGGATVCGVQYDSYGLLNQDEKKNSDISYKISVGSLVVGIIFLETIIVPIYVFGFDLFTPVGKKPEIKGALPVTECK